MFAQVPPTLSYQGMLTGSDDNPVEDGIYEMHFNFKMKVLRPKNLLTVRSRRQN
jgi:hypothetical protein